MDALTGSNFKRVKSLELRVKREVLGLLGKNILNDF